jgi:hypothetical protein
MKKMIFCLLFTASLGFAQTPEIIYRTAHYETFSDGEAIQTTQALESFYTVFNRLFRFDIAPAMKVRIISDTGEYNQYVITRAGSPHEGAVYLHYGEREKCELVINGANPAVNTFPQQALIQYFRSFISQPPAWMLEGFAIYFETLQFQNGKLSFTENLSRLPAAKSINAAASESVQAASLQRILLEGGSGSEFQAAAWSLVSFLMSGSDDYHRSLTESFMLLSETGAAQNADAAYRRILHGKDIESFTRDYRRYINERKTFSELVYDGQRAYSAGDSDLATISFLGAMELQDNYLPYYYLGLISYEAGNYSRAENYFLAAIERGGDIGACLYALGVNAAAAGNSPAALGYLQRASQVSARYREKSENIISRLNRLN